MYKFSPSPDLATRETNYAFWENAFNSDEILKIVNIGDTLFQSKASVDGDTISTDIRQSDVGWISHTEETNFIYDRLAYVARTINGQFFDFDLFGFNEDFQYTVYREGGDHYDWHMDKGNINTSPRKLSLVLQLSDPDDYTGGDLELFMGANNPIMMDRKRGSIYAFPSYILHRVTPVTAGTRKSLVAWVSGPKFK